MCLAFPAAGGAIPRRRSRTCYVEEPDPGLLANLEMVEPQAAWIVHVGSEERGLKCRHHRRSWPAVRSRRRDSEVSVQPASSPSQPEPASTRRLRVGLAGRCRTLRAPGAWTSTSRAHSRVGAAQVVAEIWSALDDGVARRGRSRAPRHPGHRPRRGCGRARTDRPGRERTDARSSSRWAEWPAASAATRSSCAPTESREAPTCSRRVHGTAQADPDPRPGELDGPQHGLL